LTFTGLIWANPAVLEVVGVIDVGFALQVFPNYEQVVYGMFAIDFDFDSFLSL
jgi:hypothetical protein